MQIRNKKVCYLWIMQYFSFILQNLKLISIASCQSNKIFTPVKTPSRSNKLS